MGSNMESVIVYVTVVLLSLSAQIDSAKIAVLIFPAGASHFLMMETVGQQLEARGHEVRSCCVINSQNVHPVQKLSKYI